MSKPKCIAFDYIDSTDEYEECFNPAFQPKGNPKYCKRHWQNLKDNMGQVFLKPAKNMDPVPSCIDKETWETYECSPSPRSPRSPRTPYSPRGVGSPVPRTPYNARMYASTPGSPLRRAAPSPRAGAGYPSTPRTMSMYSGGATFDPIDPHKDEVPTKATGCRDNSCVTTGRGISDKTIMENKETERDFSYPRPEDDLNFQRLIRSYPDFLWNTKYPNLSFSQKNIAECLHTIDTTKDAMEALNAIGFVRENFERNNKDKEKGDYNWAVSEDVVDYAAKKFSRYMYNPDRIELLLSFLFAYESRDLTQKLRYFGFKFNDATNKINTGIVDLIDYTLIGLETAPNTFIKSLAPREDPRVIKEKKEGIAESYTKEKKKPGDLKEVRANLKTKIDSLLGTIRSSCNARESKKLNPKFIDYSNKLVQHQRDIGNANEAKIEEITNDLNNIENDKDERCQNITTGGDGKGLNPANQASMGGGSNTGSVAPKHSANLTQNVVEWKKFYDGNVSKFGTPSKDFKSRFRGISNIFEKSKDTITVTIPFDSSNIPQEFSEFNAGGRTNGAYNQITTGTKVTNASNKINSYTGSSPFDFTYANLTTA